MVIRAVINSPWFLASQRSVLTIGLVPVHRFDGQQQVLVLQVLDLRQERFERGQLLVGPAHTQEVHVVAALAVVLIAFLKLYKR